MGQTLLIIFYVLSPAVIIYLSQRIRIINRIGVVVVAYIIGVIAGNTGLIPENSRELQDIITMITIPLAIPLLLFSSNIRQWASLAGRTALSMVIALISLIAMVTLGYFLFKEHGIADLWKVAGLLIGVYTGGTPNLASLKIMLDVNSEVYLLTHTYDMIVSGFYFFFLISIGQRTFNLFLRPFALSGKPITAEGPSTTASENTYQGMLKKKNLLPLMGVLGLSALIFAVAGGASLLVPEKSQMVVVILVITTLGIAGSMIPGINRAPKSFELGMYFILIFSVDVASMVDLGNLAGQTPVLFSYLLLVIFGSLLLHLLLARIFKVDTDTMIITSTALICSPPFVPVVAGALRNRHVVVSGLTVGIVGYAIGNYLGFLVAEILSRL